MGLLVVGGPPAIPLYQSLRGFLIRHKLDVLPEYNGLSGGIALLGLGAKGIPGMDPAAKLLAKVGETMGNIDMAQTASPVNYPRSLAVRDIASSAGGPTFGAIPGLLEDINQSGLISQPVAKDLLRAISPTLFPCKSLFSRSPDRIFPFIA